MTTGIDFATLARDLVGVGMDLAGTAKTAATLHLGKAQAYNFDTDASTPSGGSDPVVYGILYRTKQQQGPQTSGNESSFLIEGKDAPSGIEEADTLTIGSDKWNITNVEPLVGNAAFILTIRK